MSGQEAKKEREINKKPVRSSGLMRKMDILTNGSREKKEETYGRVKVKVRAREPVNEQIRDEIMREREGGGSEGQGGDEEVNP